MADLMQALLVETTAPDWLAPVRERGLSRWRESHQPTRKTEAWKYTSLHALDRDFVAAEADREFSGDLPELGGARLLFVDGQLRGDIPVLPEGVSLVRFADASAAQAAQIREHLGTVVAADLFCE